MKLGLLSNATFYNQTALLANELKLIKGDIILLLRYHSQTAATVRHEDISMLFKTDEQLALSTDCAKTNKTERIKELKKIDDELENLINCPVTRTGITNIGVRYTGGRICEIIFDTDTYTSLNSRFRFWFVKFRYRLDSITSSSVLKGDSITLL